MSARTDEDFEFEKLKSLFDYTKFHITVYLTLATILGGLLAAVAKEPDRVPLSFHKGWLAAAVAFLAIAGLAAGVLISSMCHEKSMREFWGKRLGPYHLRMFTAEMWTYIEHTAF